MAAVARAGRRTLDAYLESVQGLFQEQPDDFDEENALLLLHRCDYDASLALSLLQPRSSTVVDPSAAASSHSPPPPTQSPHSPQSSPSSPSTPDADTDDVCTICMDGGHLLICERRGCHRVYHPECAGLRSVPQGRWECPRHSCSACGEEWEEEGGNSRKRRRAERGSISAAELKGITGHASLISTHSHGHPHLLSPSSSAASSPTSGDSTPPTPTPHVECSACPTAYCLTHVPAAVLSAYGIAPSSLASLSLEALQAAVKGSAQGCFLCLSCMHVQERRNRLVMLRRLSEAMEGKGGESLWSEWEHRAATEEDADFTRLLHHPTEWQRIDDLLREANEPAPAQAKAPERSTRRSHPPPCKPRKPVAEARKPCSWSERRCAHRRRRLKKRESCVCA